MNKKLIAAAVGALLCPLAAQASPTFYGLMNVSLDNYAVSDGGMQPFLDLGQTSQSNWRLQSVLNLMGIKDEVALYGDNLNLIWQVERGVDITEGKSGLSVRNSFVGLSGDSWGSVFFGTYDSLVKLAKVNADVFGMTEADAFNYLPGEDRYNNTLNYRSPNMGGVTIRLQIRPGEGERVDASDRTGKTEHGLADGYGASATYQTANFWTAVAYEKGIEDGVYEQNSYAPAVFIGGGDIDYNISTLRFSIGGNIGDLQLGFVAQQRDADDVWSNPTTKIKTQTKQDYMVSLAYQTTERLRLKLQGAYSGGFYLVDDDDRKIKSVTVGADYELGKNVVLYGFYTNNSIAGDWKGHAKASDGKYNVTGVGLHYLF